MEKPLRILIVEDNESDAALIIRYLKKAEIISEYEVVDTTQQMESALDSPHWDIVICDYSLPQFNALHALKQIQATGLDIPFLVVSGTIGEEAAVEIMRAGAHDYIMKDNFARLVPVIHRELAEVEIRREHKQAEEKIQAQALLLNLIGQSVITVDKNYIVTYWNKASEELYGWHAQEVIGFNLMDKMKIQSPQPISLENIANLANSKNWSGEYIIQKKDGSNIPIHVTHSPIFDEDGNFNGVISISYDISEQKRTEEAIFQKMDELAVTNDELKRINLLTIGREIRMIELKQECNNLANQLGIKQPYPLAFLNKTVHQED